MKLLAALAIVFGTSFAFANDGSTPYINVQGIQPNNNTWEWSENNATEKRIEVYGKETVKLHAAMPVSDVMGGSSLSVFSKAYGASIWCTENYIRPTTGEERNDYMCTFDVYRSAGGPELDPEWEGDSFYLPENKDYVSSLSGKTIKALGIFPVNIPAGEVFSFYGKDAAYVAQNMVGNGFSMKSGSYTLKMACQKSYVGPISGKTENDYKCTVTLKNN